MLISTTAIVLRTTRYGDSGLVVDLFTERMGRVVFMHHVSHLKRSAGTALFQPLTLLEIDFDHRPRSAMQHFRMVRLAVPYADIPFKPEKMAVAMFLAEFLSHATREEREGGALFEFIWKSVLWFDEVSIPAPNFHIIFITRAISFLGFAPNTEAADRYEYFDMMSAGYVPVEPQHTHFLRGEEARALPHFFRATYTTMHLLKITRAQRNRAVCIMLDYCRLHLPQFPSLRSFDILRELF